MTRPMKTSSRITLNAVTTWAATLVRAGIGLVVVPFLLARLGKDGYGLCAVVATVVTFTAVADLGLRKALVRQLAERAALGDTRGFNELASSALALYAAIGGGLAAACVLAAPWLAQAFNVPPHLLPEGVFLLRGYGALAIVVSFVTPVYAGAITSDNRFDVINLAGVVTGIAQGGLLLLVLSVTDTGLYGWAGVMAATQVGHLVALRTFSHWLRPELRLGRALVRRAAFGSLFGLGGYLFLGQLSDLVGIQSAPFILSALIGPAAVAVYAPAAAMTAAFRPMVKAVAEQLHPLATAYHAQKDNQRMAAVLVRGTRYTYLLGIPSTVLLTVFAAPLTRLWLEDELGADHLVTAWVLVGWALVDLLGYSAGSQWPVQLGAGRVRFVVLVDVSFAIVDVVVSVLLVAYTSLGAVGVILPTVVLSALRRPIMTVHAARVCDLPVRRYLAEAYVRPTLVLALVAALGAGLRALVDPVSLPALLACVAAFGLAWLALTWWVGLGEADRESFRALGSRVRRRFTPQADAP